MTNFQLKYELSVVFLQNNTTFSQRSFSVVFGKIILHFFTAKIIYNKVSLGYVRSKSA